MHTRHFMNAFAHLERPPVIPDHEMLRRIGGGSYGSVWLARTVTGAFRAVKVVYRLTFSEEKPYQREFEGILQFEPISRSHPGLVDVLQVGRNDAAGCFYYVMELADDASGATPIEPDRYVPKGLDEELAARGRIPAMEALEIARRLAAGVAQLHQRGLAHRDIKPANIIFVNGEPKLADIGLVAPVRAGATVVGTPGYMAPEGANSLRADVFSLGMVLYQMATGLPWDNFPSAPDDIESFPDKSMVSELIDVTTKACHQDPEERHADADALRAELDMLLAGRSVKHLRRVERQVRVAWRAAAGAVLLACLAAGFGLVNRKLRQREATLLAAAYVRDGAALMEAGDFHRAVPPLAEALRLSRHDPAAARTLRTSLGTVLHHGPRLLQSWSGLGVLGDVRFSPGGTRLLVAGGRRVTILDIDSGRREQEFTVRHVIETAVFSPDGLTMAVANDRDVTFASLAETNQHHFRAPAHVNSAEFSPDGAHVLIACANRVAYLVDARDHLIRQEFRGHADEVWHAAFSRDGKRIVTAGKDGTVRMWDVESGEPVGSVREHAEWVFAAAFSPDGRQVASVSSDGTARVWEVTGGLAVGGRMAHRGSLRRVCYSPDGRYLLTAGWDQTARVWNAHTGEPAGPVLHLHASAMQAVFDPDGRRIAVVSAGGEVKVWLLPEAAPRRVAATTLFSEDGSTYVTVVSNVVQFWSTTNDAALSASMALPGRFVAGKCSAGGGRAVFHIRAQGTGEDVLHTVDRRGPLSSIAPAEAEFWSPNGPATRLLVRRGRVLECWNLETGAPVFATEDLPFTARAGTFSKDGRLLAVSSPNHRRVLVLSADRGERRRELEMAPGAKALLFSPDSSHLAAVEASPGDEPFVPRHARLWDVATGAQIGGDMAHGDSIRSLRFNHDGTRLLTYGSDRRAAVWDTKDARGVFEPIRLASYVEGGAFSPDGAWLVTAERRRVQVWDAGSGLAVTPPLGGPGQPERAGFCADGRRVWVSSRRELLLWELQHSTNSPAELLALAHHLGVTVPAPLAWRARDFPEAALAALMAESRRRATASRGAWHQRQAEEAVRDEDWFAAQFHLAKVVETEPNDPAWRTRLDEARARLAVPGL